MPNPITHLHELLKAHGINFATGVPCGAQEDIIYNLAHDTEIIHVVATRESEAIGIAAGAYLGGRKPIVYMQNSGLFGSSNDVASLLMVYEIPVLLSVTWRGCEGEDTPQHVITGAATLSLLESLGVPHRVLEKDNIDGTLSFLFSEMENMSIPTVMLIKKGWHE
jgi:sulfopyruvate decarboxylase alpha subunit